MPSAGKTTVGMALAKKINYEFRDLDSMVEEKEKESLIEVMNKKGPDYFREMEYRFLLDLKPEEHMVISPAGSIIYLAKAAKWIQKESFVVFLNTPFDLIEKRLLETPKAVAGLAERGLKSIWDERMPIYSKICNVEIDTSNKSVDEVVNEIIKVIK